MLGKSDVCATIGVKDMIVSCKFYEEVMGLEKTDSNPSGTFFKSGNGGVFIYPSEFAGTNKATYASWRIDDVDAAAKELKDKGVQFEQIDGVPGMTREGDIHIMGEVRSAWFKDPEGNILNIVNRMG